MRHLLDESRIEGRTPGKRRREHRRPQRGEPGQALLVGNCRYAEPRVVEQAALQLAKPLGSLAGLHRLGAQHAGQVAHTILGQLVVGPLPGEDVLHRSDVPRDVVGAPCTAELGQLLLQRHQREE
jgi:hypothetical protein